MIGLVLVLVIIVIYFEASTVIIRAYESTEQTVQLKAIPMPEQDKIDEKIKTEWTATFTRLLNETQGYREAKK
jgi:hypothetical protein